MFKVKKKIQDFLQRIVRETNENSNDYLLFKQRYLELSKMTIGCKETGVSSEQIFDYPIIVSLTTYGERLYEVYAAIESIMQGTLKPNRIILWLDEGMKSIDIPIYLQLQTKRGLEINYCEDILSYKKLIPTLRLYPDSIIITIDDDVMYDPDMVEKLVNAYKHDSHHVYANRVRRICHDDTGRVSKYATWPIVDKVSSSSLNFPTGVGGVLYPPHCFHKDVLNTEKFMSMAKYGDDIWFYAMALLNGYTVSKVYTHTKEGEDYTENQNVLFTGLHMQNLYGNRNDPQIRAVFANYNIYELLKNEK